MTKALTIAAVFLATLLLCGLVCAQTPVHKASNEWSWLDGFTLVVLDSDDTAGLHRARKTIQAHGGRVAIMSPPSYILGWVPHERRRELIGKAGIKDIFYTEVGYDEVAAADAQSRSVVGYFNAVARGDIQKQQFDRANMDASLDLIGGDAGTRSESSSHGLDRAPDAHPRPPFDEAHYLKNLEDVGLKPERLRARGQLMQSSAQGVLGNSDTMTGTIAVTVFFVESDGSGTDPDMYTWNTPAVQNYINDVNTGLAWWTDQASGYFDCWNAFFVRFFPPTDPRCQQEYEPVLHAGLVGAVNSQTWVDSVMTNFGYTSGGDIAKVDAYNSFQRTTYGTDWAFSSFVAYNPLPAADRFTDGVVAYAWLDGPYSVLLFRAGNNTPLQVYTHETGHIFGACDEYVGSNCACSCSAFSNDNCHLCAAFPCIMKNNTFDMCAYTPAQVGWFANGCAPPALAAPGAQLVTPGSQLQGFGQTVNVVGSNFLFGADVDMGPGVTINTTTFVSPETLVVDLFVENDASAGPVDVVVTNRDLQTDTIAGGFEILRTVYHYASPTGGDVFPYNTPATAAQSLVDAVAAAGPFDTLRVTSASYANIDFSLTEAVRMSGAWNDAFTSRDLVNGKTVLDIRDNILVTSPLPAAIDGFILENGNGRALTTPIPGDYGGAITVINSAMTISNCEIRSNVVGGAGSYGGGGAVYGLSSTVNILNTTITGNSAAQGGAVFLNDCSGSISGSVVDGNNLTPSAQSALGAGIYMLDSGSYSIRLSTISNNTGALHGGGVYLSNATVLVADSEIRDHSVSQNGGGIAIDSSQVIIAGSMITRNSSGSSGGGIYSVNESVIDMSDCEVLWNTAPQGGGSYVTGSEAYIDHSLWVGNDGGGCVLLMPTGGSFIGNTMDRNTGGFGSVIFQDAAIPVFNNIIVNSGSSGAACFGATTPTFQYNNVWNSQGADYSGCTAGIGSVNADPLFADTAFVDYHLTLHSPCIDTGDTSAAYVDPDRSRGDMGWYGSHSFNMAQPWFPTDLQAPVVSSEVVLSWSPNPPANNVQSYAVYKDTVDNFSPTVNNFVQLVAAPTTSFNDGPFVDGTYYRISAVNTSGYAGGYSQTVPADPSVPPLPFGYRLDQNHPNPFNPETFIEYEVADRVHVSLTVFDIEGKLVKQLVNKTHGPGSFVEEWDGTNQSGQEVSTGVYFYRISAGSFNRTKKMVFLK